MDNQAKNEISTNKVTPWDSTMIDSENKTYVNYFKKIKNKIIKKKIIIVMEHFQVNFNQKNQLLI